jgi:long-subunit acyl-CoA synthetase (AMP-forming)
MTATPGGTATCPPVPSTMCAAFQATGRRMPGGELVTLTMKVRRRAVLRAYADRIDALYAEK